MKIISERENREEFIGIHQMLYELVGNELCNRQFIVIDTELYAPEWESAFDFDARHMRPGSTGDDVPIITYYVGT